MGAYAANYAVQEISMTTFAVDVDVYVFKSVSGKAFARDVVDVAASLQFFWDSPSDAGTADIIWPRIIRKQFAKFAADWFRPDDTISQPGVPCQGPRLRSVYVTDKEFHAAFRELEDTLIY